MLSPVPSMYMPRRHRHSDWDDDITSYYYTRLVEVSDEEEEDDDDQRSRNSRRRHHLILEIESSDDDDDKEDDDTDDEEPWEEDPYSLCMDELPLWLMSRFCKAFIDVVFVVAAILTEGSLVWMALQDDDTSWFIALLTMLPFMIVLLYFMVTRDLEADSRPKPSLPDENV